MSLKDVFSAEADRAIRYGKDLGLIVLSPRQYVRRISDETADDTIHRLIIYAVGFAAFEIALFKVALRGPADISIYDVVGLTILELSVYYCSRAFSRFRIGFGLKTQ